MRKTSALPSLASGREDARLDEGRQCDLTDLAQPGFTSLPGGCGMRITTCYSTGQVETTVTRGLESGQGPDYERRLIISCPFGQLPIHTYAAVRHLLTDEEIREVRKAFGWEVDRSADPA